MASPASVGARGRVVRGARWMGEAGASEADTDLARALTDSSGRVEVDMRLCRLDGSVCDAARCRRGEEGPARAMSVAEVGSEGDGTSLDAYDRASRRVS